MKKAILFSFIGIQSVIVALLLFAADGTDHYIKKEQLFSNPVYFGAGAAAFLFVLLLSMVFTKYCSKEAFARVEKPAIVITLLLFLGISIFICLNGFFYSDWDPAGVLRGAFSIYRGVPEEAGEAYFLHYPNNLLLAVIYSTVLRAGDTLGTGLVDHIVILQCILLSASAFLVYRILGDMLKDNRVAFIGLVCFEIWIAFLLSPWFIITYSDQMGFIFPLLILRLGQKIMAAETAETAETEAAGTEASGTETSGKETSGTETGSGKGVPVRLCIMTAIACFGYFIKPQIVIVYIATLLCLGPHFFRRENKKRAISLGVLILTAILTLGLTRGVIMESPGIKTDPSQTIGLTHYFMMGLNDRTDGVYADEDTEVSLRGEDMKVAGERIREYGVYGLLRHGARKIMVNFNDGSFAWGIDGNFFAGRSMDDWGDIPETAFTRRIWDFIITDGKDHGKYASTLQSLWFGILLADLVAALFVLIKKKEDETLYTVMLSLIGLFLFELLFEAKARYLFIYTPFYLIPGIFLLKGLADAIRERLAENKS